MLDDGRRVSRERVKLSLLLPVEDLSDGTTGPLHVDGSAERDDGRSSDSGDGNAPFSHRQTPDNDRERRRFRGTVVLLMARESS